MNKKIKEYSAQFESKKRVDNGEDYIILKDNAPKELRESVRKAHGDSLPNDWIYGTYADLLSILEGYEITDANDLDNYRHEIVDNYVDIYTSDLTKWLGSNSNTYYLTRALEDHQPKDGVQALGIAQYTAIDEIMSEIVNLLTSK